MGGWSRRVGVRRGEPWWLACFHFLDRVFCSSVVKGRCRDMRFFCRPSTGHSAGVHSDSQEYLPSLAGLVLGNQNYPRMATLFLTPLSLLAF